MIDKDEASWLATMGTKKKFLKDASALNDLAALISNQSDKSSSEKFLKAVSSAFEHCTYSYMHNRRTKHWIHRTSKKRQRNLSPQYPTIPATVEQYWTRHRNSNSELSYARPRSV